ncbi:hypothetical protein FKM82_017427 [Ascaphus truei]
MIHTPSVDVILGLPWLQLHNPQLDWVNKEPIRWSLQTCLPPKQMIAGVDLLTEYKTSLPTVYRDLADVFDKVRSEVLPPIETLTVLLTFFPVLPYPRAVPILSPYPGPKPWPSITRIT